MMSRIPKTIIANGHTLTPEGIRFACCRKYMMPAAKMIRPMAIPTIAPAPGMPKHSFSTRL
jgi:hypothetical protein